jgi:hypothetical protein
MATRDGICVYGVRIKLHVSSCCDAVRGPDQRPLQRGEVPRGATLQSRSELLRPEKSSTGAGFQAAFEERIRGQQNNGNLGRQD